MADQNRRLVSIFVEVFVRPIFTIHAGEFLVGDFIERQFPELDVWVPTKDTGVDLLVTNRDDKKKSAALQVKMSRDYKSPYASNSFQSELSASGWVIINHDKLKNSKADYWVFILVSHERKQLPHYIIIPTSDLLHLLISIHGQQNKYHFYPWVLRSGVALQGRGIKKKDRESIITGNYVLGARELTVYLGNWSPLQQLV